MDNVAKLRLNRAVARAIRELRTKKCMTRRQVFEAANVQENTYSNFENGVTFPNSGVLEAIGLALGTTAAGLINAAKRTINAEMQDCASKAPDGKSQSAHAPASNA
ncbi:helix-turn-helix transcriptional regulator [Nocardia sp. NPDC050435]|uniref:helix-turn-helix domain-containing protein n=1 Tax=Nocardia sp. NPDC050435 TaxID=3155040 RepID=UPI00340FCA1D